MTIANVIDHTLLQPSSTSNHIKVLCTEALQFGFAAVCVPPFYVKTASSFLLKHPIKIATAIGYPVGYSTIPAKVEEIKRAINDGVDELDVMINLCAVKDGNWNYVKNDIDSVARISHMRGKTIKVIFETSLLSSEEIKKLCEICSQIGVDFVKNSTDFQQTSVDAATISLLKSYLSNKVKITASGGISSYEEAIKLVNAGATRLACTASLEIVKGQIAQQNS